MKTLTLTTAALTLTIGLTGGCSAGQDAGEPQMFASAAPVIEIASAPVPTFDEKAFSVETRRLLYGMPAARDDVVLGIIEGLEALDPEADPPSQSAISQCLSGFSEKPAAGSAQHALSSSLKASLVRASAQHDIGSDALEKAGDAAASTFIQCKAIEGDCTASCEAYAAATAVIEAKVKTRADFDAGPDNVMDAPEGL